MTEFGVGFLSAQHWQETAKLARTYEEMGFDQIWIPDERFFREIYSTMTVVAMNTTRVKISTGITDPFTRHPALTALAIATVDEISGGRVCVGLASGSSGMRQMRIVQKNKPKAVKEAVEVMRALFKGEAPLTYEGETVKTTDAEFFFKARPDIPIFVVGTGPQVLKNGGRVADGVMTDVASPVMVQHAWDLVDAGAREAGRDPKSVKRALWLHMWIHEDGKVARESARWYGAVCAYLYGGVREKLGATPVVPELKAIMDKIGYSFIPEELAPATPYVTDEFLSEHALVGTPQEILAQMQELKKLGVDQFAVFPWGAGDHDAVKTAEIFAREIIPKFR